MKTKHFFRSIRKQFVREKKQPQVISETTPDIVELLKENDHLRMELDYLYSILQQPSCRNQLHVIPRQLPFLVTTRCRATHRDIIVTLVEKRREIVKIFTHAVAEDMAIDDFEIDISNYHKHIGTLLLQKMVIEAKALGLRRITGKFGSNKEMHFQFLTQLYSEMGFVVTQDADQQKGDIIFCLPND